MANFEQEKNDLQDLRNVGEHVGETIEHSVVDAYKAIETGVVGAYKKVEETVVGSFTKMTDGVVERFLTHEGETVEEAKARITAEQTAREEAQRAAMDKRAAEQEERIAKVNAMAGVKIDIPEHGASRK